jgi:ABC-type Fe3+/spermidine/putrescine transport system ATPase subunit
MIRAGDEKWYRAAAEEVLMDARKDFWAFTAVNSLSRGTEDGECTMLVGLYGWGGTTALRRVAGLEDLIAVVKGGVIQQCAGAQSTLISPS